MEIQGLSVAKFSLVILTSRFEATRGLLLDEPRNFEPRLDAESDTPSPNFQTTPVAGHLATTYDLASSRPHTRQIFSGIGFPAWDPPAPRPRPCHLGPQRCLTMELLVKGEEQHCYKLR
ncbi:hypothetical protein AVEN_186715-1 [Araneus ventricosus]|uniref:Uncharacterized protein n=1 Tax=Araneus ventricosus TaxID=182803 RepID=A0A4Y2U3D9_ARAVE|nr:hypothetical protein AVEN_186715-1 [Araneus ventricosus]